MPRTAIEIAPSITVRDETGELVETSLRDVSSEAICRAQTLPYLSVVPRTEALLRELLVFDRISACDLRVEA